MEKLEEILPIGPVQDLVSLYAWGLKGRLMAKRKLRNANLSWMQTTPSAWHCPTHSISFREQDKAKAVEVFRDRPQRKPLNKNKNKNKNENENEKTRKFGQKTWRFLETLSDNPPRELFFKGDRGLVFDPDTGKILSTFPIQVELACRVDTDSFAVVVAQERGEEEERKWGCCLRSNLDGSPQELFQFRFELRGRLNNITLVRRLNSTTILCITTEAPVASRNPGDPIEFCCCYERYAFFLNVRTSKVTEFVTLPTWWPHVVLLPLRAGGESRFLCWSFGYSPIFVFSSQTGERVLSPVLPTRRESWSVELDTEAVATLTPDNYVFIWSPFSGDVLLSCLPGINLRSPSRPSRGLFFIRESRHLVVVRQHARHSYVYVFL